MEQYKTSASNIQNLGNSGAPYKATVGNREITYRLIDQKAKAQFEAKLIARAKKDLQADKDNLSDEEFATAYSVLSDKIIAGNYSFGGKLANAHLVQLPGLVSLLSIVTGLTDEDTADLVLQNPLEAQVLFNEIISLSFPQMSKKDETGDQKKT